MYSKIILQFCKIENFILQIFNIRIARKNNFSILQHTNYEIQHAITRKIYPAILHDTKHVVNAILQFCTIRNTWLKLSCNFGRCETRDWSYPAILQNTKHVVGVIVQFCTTREINIKNAGEIIYQEWQHAYVLCYHNNKQSIASCRSSVIHKIDSLDRVSGFLFYFLFAFEYLVRMRIFVSLCCLKYCQLYTHEHNSGKKSVIIVYRC